MNNTQTKNTIEFTKINRDVNGNPRYVCHFLSLLTNDESYNKDISLLNQYRLAVNRARSIGGKKFDTKKYGCGIVFQSYNIRDLETSILDLVSESLEVK